MKAVNLNVLKNTMIIHMPLEQQKKLSNYIRHILQKEINYTDFLKLERLK